MLVTVIGIALTPLLGQSLFPGFKERDFLIHWVTPAGHVRRGDAADHARGQQGTSRRFPGCATSGLTSVRRSSARRSPGSTSARTGSASTPSVDYDETLDEIEDVNDAYPGLFRETQTYLDERIEEVISGGKEPIVVRVYGQNLTVLREKADEIEKIMGTIEGVQDQHTDISTDVPAASGRGRILPRPRSTASSPATYAAPRRPWSPARKSATSSAAARPTTSWCGAPRRRATSVPDIQNLRIDTPSGKTVRLADVAKVSLQPSPNAIEREGDSRRLDVSATFEGRTSVESSDSSSRSSTTSSSSRATTPRSSASTRSGSRPSALCW